MKNLEIEKNKVGFLVAILSLCVVIMLVLCVNGQNLMHSKNIANTHAKTKSGDLLNAKDIQFLIAAVEINLEEIKLARIAKANATMIDIKQVGKTMENTHLKCLKSLQILAQKKQIKMPTTFDQKSHDVAKFIHKKDIGFDKEYCDMMIQNYTNVIDSFEIASIDAADSEIRSWANSMLPTLKSHLGDLVICQMMID